MSKTRVQKIAVEAQHKVYEEALQIAEAEESSLPGTIVSGRKKPWTRADVEARFPKVSFVSAVTEPVTFQGVSYQLLAGIETMVPQPIYDIYLQSQRKKRMAGTGKSLMTSLGVAELSAGAGVLPPES